MHVFCLQITVDGASSNFLSLPGTSTQQTLTSHPPNTANAPPSPPFVLPATTPPPALCHIPHPLLHPMFTSQAPATSVQTAPAISQSSPPTMYLPVNTSSADSSYHFYLDNEGGDHQNRERRARISLSHLSQSVSKLLSMFFL